MADYGDDWSDEELRICAEQYADVVRRGGTSKGIARDIFVSRAERALPGRTRDSVLMRMGNISAVMELNNQPIVIGWGVRRNVGSGVTPRLEAILREFDLL
jgi:hypothetical protein